MRQSTLIAGVLLAMVFAAGCAQQQVTSYDKGIAQMSKLQGKYGADFQKAPLKEAIPSLIAELQAFQRKVMENEDTKALMLVVEYRIRALESDQLLLEGFKWGDASTTELGFGCRKGSERLLNSSALRIMAAEEGVESIEPLRELIEKYPDKAAALNLSQRVVLSLTTTYAVVEEQAMKDKGNVEGFCKDSIEVVQDADGLYHVTFVDDSGE